MAGNATTKVKFYVTTVAECPNCGGVGSAGNNGNDYIGKPCTDCGGTGTLEDAVELTTALAALGILTRLEQAEKTAGRAAYESSAMLNGGI